MLLEVLLAMVYYLPLNTFLNNIISINHMVYRCKNYKNDTSSDILL